MPISITLPAPNTPIGPMQAVSTTFDGPTPLDDEIEIRITHPSDENVFVLLACKVTQGSNFLTLRFNVDQCDPSAGSAYAISPAQGTAVRLVATHRSATGVIRSQVSQQMTWDGAGQVTQYGDQFQWGLSGTVSGGFTEEDRAQAQITQMGVSLPLPGAAVGQEIASGLTGFFTNPPQWAMQNLDFVDLEGNGDLTRPGAGRQVNAYGCQVSFLSIPPSLGVNFTVPAQYHETIAQLAVVRSGLSQLEYYDLIVPFNIGDQRLMWGTPFPVRISYSIFPGCVVRLWWLHLAPSWWPF